MKTYRVSMDMDMTFTEKDIAAFLKENPEIPDNRSTEEIVFSMYVTKLYDQGRCLGEIDSFEDWENNKRKYILDEILNSLNIEEMK